MSAMTEQQDSELKRRMDRFREKHPGATPAQLIKELQYSFASCCGDWKSLEDYVAEPDADLYLIAEIFHYAPDFVRRQPRWAEIERHPEWQANLGRPKRKLPASGAELPAYYVETLLESGTGREIVNCFGRRGLKAYEHFDRLVKKRDQTIDGYFAEIEKRPEWQLHFAKSTYPSVRLRVAQSEYALPETLRLLCVDKNRKVAEAAMRHRKFPADAAKLVAEVESASVSAKLDRLEALDWKSLGEFFANPDLPGEIITVLYRREDSSIRFACAMHPNAPEAVWRESLRCSEEWQRAAVALNPAVPSDVLRELAASDGFDISFALASNPNLPEDLQVKLANHPERAIRHHVADHTRSVAVWAEVIKHPGPKHIQSPMEHYLALAIDPKTPGKKLKAFYADIHRRRSAGEVLSTAISTAIALHPKFPPELVGEWRYYQPWFEQQNKAIALMVLEGAKLQDPRPYLEWKLSSGRIGQLPAHVANHLLVQGDVPGRRVGCSHARCDRALLVPQLFIDDVPLLKRLAERKDMPRYFYEILWATSPDSVRAILTQNPATARRQSSFASDGGAAPAPAPKPVAKVVVREGKMKVSGSKKERAELASNSPDLQTLSALARDPAVEVRSSLAENPDMAASMEICALLAKDENSAVRRALAGNRRLPWEVAAELALDGDMTVVDPIVRRLHKYPMEMTEAVERKLLEKGPLLAELLARHSCNRSLQLELVSSQPEALLNNSHCSPETAIALLRQGEIDPRALFGLITRLSRQCGHEVAGEIAMKAMRLGFEALVSPDSLTAYSAIFPDATDEEKRRFRERAAAFVQAKQAKGGESIDGVYGSLMTLPYECRDYRPVNDMVVSFFDSRAIPKRAVREVLPTLIRLCRMLPLDWQRRFAAHDLEGVRQALAGRDDLAEDVIEKLSQDPEESVRRALLSHGPGIAGRFVKDPSGTVRGLAARVVDASCHEELSMDADSFVLSNLAANSSCSASLLDRLAQHKKWEVRCGVAKNRAAPVQLLIALLDDVRPDVRHAAKYTLATVSDDIAVHRRLIEEGNVEVLRELARNPASHEEILERLFRNGVRDVLVALATNTNLPGSVRAQLASHPQRHIRDVLKSAEEKTR